jgi:hypothetical protein
MHSELRTTLKRRAEDLHSLAGRENRSLTAAESSQFDGLIARVTELDEGEVREARAAKHRVDLGLVDGGTDNRGRWTTNENSPYQNPRNVGVDAPSFFRDLRDARLGNQTAGERLGRNQQIRAPRHQHYRRRRRAICAA